MKQHLITLLSLLLFSVATAGEIKDDFSKDMKASKWSYWKAAKAVAVFSHNAVVGNQAPGCLELKYGPGNTGGACFLKRIPIQPGKTYNAVVYMKGEGLPAGTKCSLAFQGLDENKKFINYSVVSSKREVTAAWQRMVLTFKVPTEKYNWDKARFLLCTLGTGKAREGSVFFDDFEFFEEEAE